VGYEAYDSSLQLYPNHFDGIVSIENTGDVGSRTGEAGQPHNDVGSFEALDQTDMIFDNCFEMYGMDWSSPAFPSVAGNMPTFDWDAGGFDGHNDACGTM